MKALVSKSYTYEEFEKLLLNKNRQERLNLIIASGNEEFILRYVDNYKDMLECYAVISKKTKKDFSRQIYDSLIECQNEDLILKYLPFIKHEYLVKELLCFLKDDKKKLIYLRNNKDILKPINVLVALSLEDDLLKVKACNYLYNVYDKIRVIITIKDEKIRANMAMEIDLKERMMIIKTIKDHDLLVDLYNKNKEYNFGYQILSLIHDDLLKINELGKYDICKQVSLIASLDYERNIQKLILDEKYDNYCNVFIARLTDEDFICRYFNKLSTLMLKLKLLKEVSDQNLVRKLINLIDDMECRKLLLSNFDGDKQLLLSDVVNPDMVYDIDSNITIGVEIEACCMVPEVYLNLKKILGDWNIKFDRSVHSGVEIVSPILKFNQEKITELKYVCDNLVRNGFYVNETCGGHIHLGFDYFKSLDEFKVFLSLYSSVENILYLISNRAGSRVRNDIDKYAKKITPILKSIPDRDSDLVDYISIIKECCGSRYYGLNLYNVFTDKNTIEFRMPNGEIEFPEIILNIRLFTKLLEKSREINSLLNSDNKTLEELEKIDLYKDIVNETNEWKKLNKLLKLLFPMDSGQEYIERYMANKKGKKNKVRKLERN